jgi:branched-chain amino acid transport system permease protein
VSSAVATAPPAAAPPRRRPGAGWLRGFRPRIACGVHHTTYAEDMALRTTPAARLRLALVVLAAVVFPFVASDYAVGEANRLFIAIIAALGLNILVGFTGLISVAQGAFLAVGAYTTAIMTVTYGLPFWLSLPTAGLMAAAVGAVFGIPSLRLKGLYLLIATLAAQVIVEWLILHLVWLTKGPNGIYGIKPPALGPLEFADRRAFYFLMLFFLAVAILFAANLFRTKIGRAFVAIRDQDIAASVIGVDLFRYKLLAFAVSSFYVGIAGALQAHDRLIVSPEYFNIGVSIEFLGMIIIGGLGSISGAIYGAAFIRLLPAALSILIATIGLGGMNVGVLQQAVFGLAIVGFLIFEPHGIAKIWRDVKDYFRLWPFSY